MGFMGRYSAAIAVGPAATLALWNSSLSDLTSAQERSAAVASIGGANVILGGTSIDRTPAGGAPPHLP